MRDNKAERKPIQIIEKLDPVAWTTALGITDLEGVSTDNTTQLIFDNKRGSRRLTINQSPLTNNHEVTLHCQTLQTNTSRVTVPTPNEFTLTLVGGDQHMYNCTSYSLVFNTPKGVISIASSGNSHFATNSANGLDWVPLALQDCISLIGEPNLTADNIPEIIQQFFPQEPT